MLELFSFYSPVSLPSLLLKFGINHHVRNHYFLAANGIETCHGTNQSEALLLEYGYRKRLKDNIYTRIWSDDKHFGSKFNFAGKCHSDCGYVPKVSLTGFCLLSSTPM